MRATCPVHLSRLDLRFLTMSSEEYNTRSSVLVYIRNFFHYPVISSLLALNIFLSTLGLLSNTFSLCSSLKVRDQISQPYNTTGNVLTFNFLECRRDDNIFLSE